MSQRKIKPKASVKSILRDADKVVDELQGINVRLKSANNQLAQAHVAMHAWVKKLEERVEILESHCGVLPVEELAGEPATDTGLERPSEEVVPAGESTDVVVEPVESTPASSVDSQQLG